MGLSSGRSPRALPGHAREIHLLPMLSNRGNNLQRIKCLEKKLDALSSKLGTVQKTAEDAKGAADGAVKTVGSIKLPNTNGVVLEWASHPNSCLAILDGNTSAQVRDTCSDGARQRFNVRQ